MNRNGRFRRRMPRIYWAVLVAGLMLVVPGAGLVVQAPSAAVEGAGTESGGAGAAGEQPAPFPVVEKLEPWEADWRRIAPKLLRDKSVAETPWSEFVFRHVGLKMREDWHSDGRVASSRVRDGELDLRYEVRNRQVNVYLPGASRVGATALHDLRLIPRLTRPEECDAETRRDGLVLLRRGGSEILADPSTGFAHRMTSRYPNGEVRWERWQWQPIEYPGNIIFPKLSAEASYHDGNLSSLELVLIESASFNQSFPADAFTLSVPADTNVVDYRKDDFRPRVFRLKEPVDDLSAYLR